MKDIAYLSCIVITGALFAFGRSDELTIDLITEAPKEAIEVPDSRNLPAADSLSNQTPSVQGNVTASNVTAETVKNDTKANSTFKVACQLNSTDFAPVVEIVNSTKLLKLMQVQTNITSPQTPATCVVVLFYSPGCPFSCMAAPHFNALPRVFPDIKIAAVDTSTRYNFNAQYGIVGVPSLLLFHNGRPAARFNNTTDYSLSAFAKFITQNTGLKPQGKLFVTSVDFSGPISSVLQKQTDYILVTSWIFMIIFFLYIFFTSTTFYWIVDVARSAWREAEAQHQHQE